MNNTCRGLDVVQHSSRTSQAKQAKNTLNPKHRTESHSDTKSHTCRRPPTHPSTPHPRNAVGQFSTSLSCGRDGDRTARTNFGELANRLTDVNIPRTRWWHRKAVQRPRNSYLLTGIQSSSSPAQRLRFPKYVESLEFCESGTAVYLLHLIIRAMRRQRPPDILRMKIQS